jgi:hypothetical protein
MLLNRGVFIKESISLDELEILVSVTEGFCLRYDIPEQVYRDLLQNQEELYLFLKSNAKDFATEEMWDKAIAANRYIVLCLNQRLNVSEIDKIESISSLLGSN